MADNQNIQITLSAQDNLTPQLQRSAVSLDLVQRALDQFDKQMQAAGTSQAKMGLAITQATQFLGALGTSVTAAGQTLDKFGASIDRGVVRQLETMQAGVRAANAELGQLQRFGIEGTQGVAALGGAVGTMLPLLATLGITLSLRSLVNVATESVALAAKMQDLNLAFKAIDGSASAANATLSHLFETSQRLGVNFVEIADGFKRMDQAAKGTTLEGQGIRQVFDNVLSGARVLGVSSQQAQGAIVALEQILTKGKLSAEEYRRQLGNAIPGALKLMADGFGVTTQQLEQMITSGIIPGTTAIIAFGKAMGELGGTQQQGTVERLSSTFAQLKNETVAWMTTLGEGIGSTLQPFLQDLIKISEEARKLLGLKPPGTQATPGANQGGFFSRFFPGPLSPETLGMPAPGTTGPNEMPGARPQAALSFASSRYDALIRQEAARAGIDPGIFSRLIKTESNFDPRATGPAIPGQGNARGLGGIMPATGGDYGLASITDFYDPQKNVPASANILRDYTAKLKKDFGDLDDLTRIALAAYNAGIGNVEKAIRETIAIGEKVTYGQVLGRLPQPQQTGPYVEKIAGPYARPGLTSVPTSQGVMPGAPLGATPASTPALDPMGDMLRTIGKTMDETLAGITKFQQKMDDLRTSGMDFAGIFGKGITDGADELVKKFTQAGNLLISFPGLLAKMSSEQREAVVLAAQQVAIFQQRVLDETQSEGNARKRVDALREIERLEEQITNQAKQQIPAMETTLGRIGTFLARPESSAAEQARAQVVQQGTELQAAATKALETLRTNPAILRFAPDMAARFEAAFAAIPDAVAQQGQRAFDLVAQEQHAQLVKLAAEVGAAGLTPLDAQIEGIKSHYEQMTASLQRGRAGLGLGDRALSAQIEASLPAAQQAAIDRATTETVRTTQRHIQDLSLTLSGAADEPRQRELLKIQQWGEDMGVEIDKILTNLPAKLEGQRAIIEQLRDKIAPATERKTMESSDLYRTMIQASRSIEQTFTNMWETVFSGGVTSFRQLGLVLAQSLQKTFAQIAAQLTTALMNAATGTTEAGGGWPAMLAKTFADLFHHFAGSGGSGGLGADSGAGSGGASGGGDFSGSGPSDSGGFGDFSGGEATFVPAARGGLFAGLGTIRRLAGGSVVDRPSFALLGENSPMTKEAVIPMIGDSVPVQFTGQQQVPQQVVIELHQSYEGAYDPRMNKTSKREVIAWVIDDINKDGPTRRVIKQHAR